MGERTAIVTGGSRGIGLASAKVLARDGFRVVVASRSAENLEVAAAALRAAGAPDVLGVATDLRQPDAAHALVQQTLTAFDHIDVLVNSAGDAQAGAFLDLTDADWQRSLDLKLFATIRMLRAVIPTMRQQHDGRIITIAGAAGRQPEAAALPVAAANAGLLAITRGLADEFGPDGISIVAINPGRVRTDRYTARIERAALAAGRPFEELAEEARSKIVAATPLRRFAEAEDIAEWVGFLASDRARHFTGQSITVDGGINRPPG